MCLITLRTPVQPGSSDSISQQRPLPDDLLCLSQPRAGTSPGKRGRGTGAGVLLKRCCCGGDGRESGGIPRNYLRPAASRSYCPGLMTDHGLTAAARSFGCIRLHVGGDGLLALFGELSRGSLCAYLVPLLGLAVGWCHRWALQRRISLTCPRMIVRIRGCLRWDHSRPM